MARTILHGMNSSTRQTGWFRGPVAWLLLAAALLRGAIIVAGSDNLARDPDAYRAMAEQWISTGSLAIDGRPSAYRPPLYPLLLGAWGKCFGLSPASVGVLQWILGVATVGLVLRVGKQWEDSSGVPCPPQGGHVFVQANKEHAHDERGHGTRTLVSVSCIAAMLVAIDPILLYQSTQVMTETLATLLAVVALLALGVAGRSGTARAGFLAGLSIAVATLCRPTFLSWGILAALAFLLLPQSTSTAEVTNTTTAARRRWLPAIACLVGLVIGLSPWAIRNFIQLGRPIATTAHGGFTFLLANNDDYFRHLQSESWRKVWTSEALVARWQTEVERFGANDELSRDRLSYQLAWDDIRQQPTAFAVACLVRFARFWSVVPHQLATDESAPRTALRWSVGLGYALEHVLMLLGIVVLMRTTPASRCWLWGLLLMIAFTGAHLFYWTDMRMRAPVVPAECLFSAVGAVWLGARFARRKPL